MKTKLLAMCIVTFLSISYSNNMYAQRDAGGSSGGAPIDPATGSPYGADASEPCTIQPPPESFKRNNGDGTCGKDGQIRLKFNSSPSAAPRLVALKHMDGANVTNIDLPIDGDVSELAKKKYISYCIEGANIKPAKKLIAVFRFPGNCQGEITLSEN